MEMLVVMSILIILMGLGFSAYASFTETTRFNQDVANLQSDILVLQRASMLLERKPDEYWLYGVGIDFNGVRKGNGQYSFFKWCSEFEDFGNPLTKGEYPYDDPENSSDGKIPSTISNGSKCDNTTENRLLRLGGYMNHTLGLKDDVKIESKIRFLLFESVSGRAFLYEGDGTRVDADLDIVFKKNFGQNKTLTVNNLTGRTKITEYIPPTP